jgi:hypothetical protein
MHTIRFFTLIAFIYSFHVLANLTPKQNRRYVPATDGNKFDAPPAQIKRLSLPGGKIETIYGSSYPYTHKINSQPSKPLPTIHEKLYFFDDREFSQNIR